MSLSEYLIGLAYLAATLGAVVWGSLLIVRRRLGHLVGPPRVLALMLIATAGVILAHLVPGILGVLTREAVVVTAVIFLAATAAGVRAASGPSPASRPDAVREDEEGDPDGRAGLALGIAAAALVLVYTLAYTYFVARKPMLAFDELAYRLPNVGRWIQGESIWGIHLFGPAKFTGTYPQNGDVLQLAAILPWRNDAFVRFAQVPYLVMTGLAIYAAARELRTPRGEALLFASLILATPLVAVPALVLGYPDTLALATFGAGAFFLIRNLRTGARSDLVLAGIGLGISFGTKWYGPYSAAAVLATWIVVGTAHRLRSRRAALVDALAVTGVMLLSGGFWLLRNLIETGNPLPSKVSVLGVTVFDGRTDPLGAIFGHSIADYFGNWGAWSAHILPAFADVFGVIAGPLLLAGVLAGAAISLRKLPRPGAPAALILAISALMIAAIYVFLPGSAPGFDNEPTRTATNTRWVGPAVLLAAVVAAWITSRLGRLRIPLAIGAFAALIQALASSAVSPPFSLVLKVVAVVLAAAIAVGLYRARTGALMPDGRVARAALAVAAAAVVTVWGHLAQRDENRGRYQGSDQTIDWVLRNPASLKIGLSGEWSGRGAQAAPGLQPAWPLFGPDLRNGVSYVGQIDDGLLDPYPTRGQWAEAVQAGGYDLLLIGTMPHVLGDANERRWAREEGFEPLASSERFVLYRPQPAPRERSGQ